MTEYGDMMSAREFIPGRGRADRAAFILVGIVLFLVLALAGLFLDLRSQVAENDEVVLRTRAVDCRIQLHLAIPFGVGDNCLDPKVTRYYDRHEKVARTQGAIDNLQVVCAILRAHDEDHPVCQSLPSS